MPQSSTAAKKEGNIIWEDPQKKTRIADKEWWYEINGENSGRYKNEVNVWGQTFLGTYGIQCT